MSHFLRSCIHRFSLSASPPWHGEAYARSLVNVRLEHEDVMTTLTLTSFTYLWILSDECIQSLLRIEPQCRHTLRPGCRGPIQPSPTNQTPFPQRVVVAVRSMCGEMTKLTSQKLMTWNEYRRPLRLHGGKRLVDTDPSALRTPPKLTTTTTRPTT